MLSVVNMSRLLRLASLPLFSLAVFVVACGGADGAVPSPPPGPSPDDAGVEASLEDGSPPGADDAGDAGSGGPFTFDGSAPEPCPFGMRLCADWPSSADGTVTKYTSRETFGGKTFERTFHVFVPAALAGTTEPAPVLVVLHGGNGSGARTLASHPWTKLAQAKAVGIGWRPNTLGCRAVPGTEEAGLAYVATAGGGACEPPVERAVNALPFIAVFPDGVPDPGKGDVRHWEDGRMPSPGFDTPAPNRDDVGFLDHVVAVLLGSASPRVDPAQLYLAGVSNGGMMTQHVASKIGVPAYPRLRRIAAFAAVVSDLPEPLSPLAGATVPFGLALFHGKDIDTPSCNTPGCKQPIVSGDERMPFGAPGSVYYVNSPDRGRVVSGPDTIAAWRGSLAAVAGAPAGDTGEDIGFFTTKETTTFASSPAVLESWVTSGGGHSFMSSRQDFHPVARAWAFVSSFRREANDTLVRRTPTWVSGRY